MNINANEVLIASLIRASTLMMEAESTIRQLLLNHMV
jgi:hypothetical protein